MQDDVWAGEVSKPPDAIRLKILKLQSALSSAEPLEARIRMISDAVGPGIAFSTSLSNEDQAILHAIATTGARVDVFTLDTGRHFPETLDVIEANQRRYSVPIRVVAPESAETEPLVARDGINGFRHSVDARKACCDVRKVRPLRRALTGASGWITGLRRGQSSERGGMPFAEYDAAFDLIKINPIADWTHERLEAYVGVHKIPVNALHARAFPSIGCQPCTRAVTPGEDIRAGRWWWEQADGKECGLHRPPPATGIPVQGQSS